MRECNFIGCLLLFVWVIRGNKIIIAEKIIKIVRNLLWEKARIMV